MFTATKHDVTWGLALAWYGEYLKDRNKNPYIAKMEFLNQYGMKAMHESLDDIAGLSQAEQDAVFEALEKYDMHYIIHTDISHFDDDKDLRLRKTEKQLELLDKYIKPCRSSIVSTCVAEGDRYDNKYSWDEKLERFYDVLGPVAKLCWEKGSPFGIENHADYYIRDLLEVLKHTPRLYLFLDTANALHIGEDPLVACELAAPYVIGGHFKDHGMERKTNGNLHFEITPCALGDGAAELRKQYEIVKEKSPFRDRLVWLFELFSPGNMTPVECFEKSVNFIRSLD